MQGGTKAKLGKRWRFPYPYTTSSYTGPRIGGTFYHAAYDLMTCEAMCDSDAECKGVYHSATECFTLHALVECDTELSGESYTRNLTAASPHHGGEPVRETWGQLPFRHLTELSCLLTRNQNLMRRAWVGGRVQVALASSSERDVRLKVRLAPNRSLAALHIVDWRMANAGRAEPSTVCTTKPLQCPSDPGVTYCSSDPAPGQCQTKMPHRPCPPCPPLPNASGSSVSGGEVDGTWPPFTVNVSNAILQTPPLRGLGSGLGGCGALEFTLHQLGGAPPHKMKGQCHGGVTVLAIASPLPWSLLEVRPLATGVPT